MKRKTSRLLSTLLSLCLALALLPGTALAADGPTPSYNRGGQNDDYGKYGSTVKSYLYENERGGLTRVEYIGGFDGEIVVVEDYNSSFQFLSGRTIPMELDLWGGFFAGENYNFFVFGQKNKDENDNKEVVRVVKYSKDWQRMGQASLYGANTVTPFVAGSLRFAEYNGELYIRTCHEMYTTSDGLNHQANMTMAVRESDMQLTDSAHEVANTGAGYVSHSFNQFILVDNERRIVALDHGDGYPRAAVLNVLGAEAGTENITRGSNREVTIQSFPGDIGDNTTGASLGGLAETAGGYVVAYNYDGAGQSTTLADRRVYFAYVDKDSLSVKTQVISDVGTTTPVLAPTGLDGGYILWNSSRNDTLYYAAYSDGGNVGEVKTAVAPLSDCQPILYNGKLVWYTTTLIYNFDPNPLAREESVPFFYALDESGVTAVKTRLVPIDNTFTDVTESDYFYDPVLWAVTMGVTTGTGDGTTFSPYQTCTTAEILTFLWRAAGSRETRESASFSDVNESDYFYTAVQWSAAASFGRIFANYSWGKVSEFKPNTPCTRAMVVEALWSLAKKPQPETAAQFTDVAADASYAQAAAWAVEQGITMGTGDGTTFSPDQTCTRAEIVTFLYRFMV